MPETRTSFQPTNGTRTFRVWVVGLLALVLWILISPFLITTTMILDYSGIQPGPVLSWARPGATERSGRFGTVRIDPDDSLLFELQPPAERSEGGFEFWLYYVKSDDPEQYDLTGLLDHGKNPGWEPFFDGEGIVYRGFEPTRLVLPHVRGNVVIGYGRTAASGIVHVVRGGMRLDLQCRTERQDSEILTIPISGVRVETGRFEWQLPNSELPDLRLDVEVEAGKPFSINRVFCVKSIGPIELLKQEVLLSAEPSLVAQGEFTWTSTTTRASLIPHIRSGASWIVHVVGFLLAWCFVGLFARLGDIASTCFRVIREHHWIPEVVVLAALVIAHGLIASKIPVFVSGDGIDYINAAAGIANGFDLTRIPDYKVPGIIFILAALMKFTSDGIAAFAWFNAAIACLNGGVSYVLVRSRAGRAWGLAAALAVGFHPTLITYQTWLLRELPSSLIMLVLSATLFFVASWIARGGRRVVIVGVVMGLLCACGAYLRENFGLLIFVVPVAAGLCCGGDRRSKIVLGLAIFLSAMVAVSPRLIHIHRVHGTWSMVSPKLAWNQLLSSWQNKTFDGNDARLFRYEEWNDVLDRSLRQPMSDYEFANRALSGYRARAGISDESPQEYARNVRAIVSEVRESERFDFLRATMLSFVNQLGLWNVQSGWKRLQAASAEYYSTILRGDHVWWPDNFDQDAKAAVETPQMSATRDQLRSIMVESRRSHRFLEDSIFGNFFNEWFHAFRAVRPVIALLFLAGIIVSAKRRDRSLFVVHCVVLAFIVATAIGTGALADRFAAPFIPTIWCCALITMANATRRSREAAPSCVG